MLLVPRQLQRAGMTGDVPYYGGRLTPAHVYAITHPSAQPPAAAPPAPAPAPVVAAARPRAEDRARHLAALQDLLTSGVLSRQEYDGLCARVLS